MSTNLSSRVINKKPTFGLVVSSRAFFNPAHAAGARADLVAVLEAAGFSYLIPDAKTTPDGAVSTLADAKAYSAFFRAHRDEIDGIIVSLANFGDEIAVTETIRRSELGVPVLVQACPDELRSLDVKGRRDSYCGKISVCNNFYQYGIAWTDTTGHVSDIKSPEFAADLDFFARVCRTVRGLKTARIGALGTRPAAFQTVRYSEKLLQASGVTVVPIDLSEVFAAVDKLKDGDPAVAEKLAAIGAYGRVPVSIDKSKVLKQAKFSVVVERWLEDNDCDASAIQCWNSIEANYGCASCLTSSMLGESLRPSACEVDVTGALSMYALSLAARAPAALLDWNNNYEGRPDLVVGTHCSNYPKSFMGTGVEISNLDLLGETFGRENCFGAIKGHVAPGPFTFFRATTDDRGGKIKCYAGEGEFTADPFDMNGGIAVCKIGDVRGLMRHVTREGFEHHVAMVRGGSAEVLREAVERYLGWSCYLHE
jgi:L-fucose isomerase and related proteins